MSCELQVARFQCRRKSGFRRPRALIFSLQPHPQEPVLSNIVNLCMVGCGAVSHWHCSAIEASGGRVRVTATVDRDDERARTMAERFGARPFDSLQAALADGDFDAVLVMLPHDLHEEAALAVFAAGKHLLLEKPIATDLETSRRILAAGRDAKGVFMVGENAFFWPEVAEAARRISAGDIGAPITATARSFCEVEPSKWHPPGAWRFDEKRVGGGIVVDGGSHWIRPLRMWMGEVDEVIAVTGHPYADMQGESQALATFRFSSGHFGSFEALVADTVMGDDWWFRITGTKGTLVIKAGEKGTLHLYNKEHPAGMLACKPGGYVAAFAAQLNAFTAAILGNTPLPSRPEDAYADQLVIDAIYRSAEARRWEKV